MEGDGVILSDERIGLENNGKGGDATASKSNEEPKASKILQGVVMKPPASAAEGVHLKSTGDSYPYGTLPSD